MNSFQQAATLYKAGRLREAGALLSDIVRREPANSLAMQLLGVIQYQSGYPREGIKLAERATSVDPNCGEAWNSLGLMRHLQGNNDAALDAFERATTVAPNLLEAWRNFGFVLQSLERPVEALVAFDRAGSGVDVAFFRGNVLSSLGRHEEALMEFERVLEADPDNGDAMENRGAALLALGRVAQAMEVLQRAQKLLGRHAVAYYNMAAAFHAAGRPDEAIPLLESALEVDPSLARVRQLKDRIEKELNDLERAARGESGQLDAETRATLAKALQAQGKWQTAIECLRGAREPRLRFLNAALMPAVFESDEMRAEALDHLEDSLDDLEQDTPTLDDPLREVAITTFHLPYFGISDRSYQERFANLYRKASPGMRFEASHSSRSGRIRLGFASALLHQHTVSRVFGGLLERLDRERFETVFLQIGKSDSVTERLAASADRHKRLSVDLAISREEIAREELDILFYPEVGMDPQTYFLAFSRLAPVQCTIWGHPFTTGSPVIDHFISSAHLERVDGQIEYTEQLAKLPTVTAYYARPPMPKTASRTEYQLPKSRRLYGCPQMAFKFHPDYDRTLAAIMERDSESNLVLIEPQHPYYKDLIVRRWQARHPILLDRAIWLRQMSLDAFLRLLQLCDVVLAPIHFGAGRSTYDALGVGAPVVTYQGSFLKSRISYALYKEMGIDELIADSEEGYVDLALRLGNDAEWRAHVKQLISARAAPLFENPVAVREFNEFMAGIAKSR